MFLEPAFSEPTDAFAKERERMVANQIERRGIRDKNVLRAMRTVPRHRFIHNNDLSCAYEDYPLAIGYGQTISQPYIVALMSELLQLQSNEKILEIGTGSGYQAAVLAEIGCTVFSIEIIKELAIQARAIFDELGYDTITTKVGDGYQGWEAHAPYDAIIVTAAAREIPQPLVDQLRIGGRMVLPVDTPGGYQMLTTVIKKDDTTLISEHSIPVRFVPLVRQTKN